MTHICVTRPQWVIHRHVTICTEPLSEPVMTYCPIYPWEQSSVKFAWNIIRIFYIENNYFENFLCKIANIFLGFYALKHKVVLCPTKFAYFEPFLCTITGHCVICDLQISRYLINCLNDCRTDSVHTNTSKPSNLAFKIRFVKSTSHYIPVIKLVQNQRMFLYWPGVSGLFIVR